MMDIEKLKAAAEKCTPLNLDSAELERGDDGCIDCPACGGEGYVDLEKDFCNIDGHAIGVQFYGIGNEFGAGEEYFRAASPATILDLIAQRDELLAALKLGRDMLVINEIKLPNTIEKMNKAIAKCEAQS